MRTEDRVIPDLLCGRDEHLVRDTEAPELRGRQGAAAAHRAASVAYAVTGAALTGWPGGTCGYRPISARSHRRVASPQPSTTLPTPCLGTVPGKHSRACISPVCARRWHACGPCEVCAAPSGAGVLLRTAVLLRP